MVIKDIFQKLLDYKDVMELNPPVASNIVSAYESCNGINLPKEFKELLMCFNGGEIFIPGTIIYGLNSDKSEYSINTINRLKDLYSIPNSFLIIGKLNFGDLICLDLCGSDCVVQWDHENNEEFYRWDSLCDWLNETIEDYQAYSEGD